MGLEISPVKNFKKSMSYVQLKAHLRMFLPLLLLWSLLLSWLDTIGYLLKFKDTEIESKIQEGTHGICFSWAGLHSGNETKK